MLRPWTLADLAAVEEASRDDLIPLITTVPSPYSHEQGVAFIRRQWSRAATGEGYSFAIAEHCGRAVGQVGLWLHNADEGRASLGYWVAASARGRGGAVPRLRRSPRSLTGPLGSPESIAWSCTSSRGTWRRYGRPSARGFSGRVCCAAGGSSAASPRTCSCTAVFAPTWTSDASNGPVGRGGPERTSDSGSCDLANGWMTGGWMTGWWRGVASIFRVTWSRR